VPGGRHSDRGSFGVCRASGRAQHRPHVLKEPLRPVLLGRPARRTADQSHFCPCRRPAPPGAFRRPPVCGGKSRLETPPVRLQNPTPANGPSGAPRNRRARRRVAEIRKPHHRSAGREDSGCGPTRPSDNRRTGRPLAVNVALAQCETEV
jgi:hypothetical protein